MKLRFLVPLVGWSFFCCEETRAENVSVDKLKAQIERMERMLQAQQRQIGELKRMLEEKIVQGQESGVSSQEPTPPSSPPSQVRHGESALGMRGEVIEDDRIEEVVEKYLEKEETKEKFAKLGLAPNLNMGFKEGFYLETLDKKFKIRLQAGLQYRYEFFDRDGDREDTSSFLVRRGRVILEGYTFSPNIEYKLQGGFDRGRDFHLLDYSFNMTHIPALNVQFGQFKAPFNRQRINPAFQLQFIDRSEANEVFTLDRQIGVMLHSKKLLDKKFEYAFGIFNGSSVKDRRATTGINREVNDNNKHLFVLRAAYNPLGEFILSEGDFEYSETLKATIAGAGAYSSDEIEVTDGTEDVDTMRLVGEAGLKYRGASFMSEVFWRHRDASQIGADLHRNSIDDKGLYAQAGYFIIPKRLELAGRFSLVDYDDNISFDNLDEIREYTGGLNYFFKGFRHRIQANVVRIEEDFRGAKDEDSYKLQMQYQIYF